MCAIECKAGDQSLLWEEAKVRHMLSVILNPGRSAALHCSEKGMASSSLLNKHRPLFLCHVWKNNDSGRESGRFHWWKAASSTVRQQRGTHHGQRAETAACKCHHICHRRIIGIFYFYGVASRLPARKEDVPELLHSYYNNCFVGGYCCCLDLHY